MKKILFLFILLVSLLLISCKEENMEINLELNDGIYGLVTEEESIDLKQYITYSKEYKVIYDSKEYSSNDDLLFSLKNGNNEFIIKMKNIEYTISIFKEYECKVNVLDENNQTIDVLTFKNNTKLTFDIFSSKYEKEGYVLVMVELSYDLKTFESVSIESIELTQDIYVKLIYIRLFYDVTFVEDGKEELITVFSGVELILGCPTKEGYTFLGWYANEIDTLISGNTGYDPSFGTRLEAKFSKNVYYITYKYNDQELKVPYEYGSTIQEFIPSIEGYRFVRWEYNGEEFTLDNYDITNDIELVAVLEKETTPVVLETFGGTLDKEVSIDNNGNIILPTPTLNNYNFKYWCSDKNLKNKVGNLNINDYNGETLYAYYEYNSDNIKDQTVVTKFNSHASNYDEVAMFDSSQSGFTSLYWKKIAITKQDDSYYVSAIANSGDKLSSLGSYDYVLLAYSGYPYYTDFVNMDCYVGYEVKFIIDPSNMSNENSINIISFVGKSLDESLIKVKEHLEQTYSSYTSVNSNISLLAQYDGYAITWKTSNREIITTKGVYKKPYMTRDVTLSAYIGDDLLYEFTVNVKGDTDTSTALSTGYIYTPYNTITQNAMDMLDIIYIAFLEIDDNGDWTNLTRVKNNINNYIRDKANKSGTKIVVSINQSKSTSFPAVAASETLRQKLANNIVTVIKDLDLDGVDIDWETPTSAQATTFTLLMKEIYTKVKAEDNDYLVTAAIGGGKWQPPKYDLVNSKQYLDYINLMTYSMTSGDGYFQNSLYPSTRSRTLVSCSVDESVKLYNSYGIENSKILLGIPFYVNLQKNCEGPGTKTGTGGSKWYNVMLDDYKLSDTMKEYFDEECGVPYRYDPTTKVFISYDNEQSIKVKCEYINTLGLAGIMYWQYGQDVDDMLTNAIKKYINN